MILDGRERPGADGALRLLFWETTAGCNLACVHCRRLDVATQMMKNDLSTAEAKAFVDSVADAARPVLVLSGGEPLIRPDLLELARHAIGRGLPVALATNGTLVDDALARRIVDAGIQRTAISIDGVDEKTHDDFRRQPGSLRRALEGFRRLRALGMPMQVNCTITRHNRHQLQALYDLAVALGAEALYLFMLVPVGCGAQIAATNMLTAGEYEEVLGWAYDRAAEGRIRVKPTCAPHYFRIFVQRSRTSPRLLNGPHTLTKGCLAGTGIGFVSHEGNVFPCGYLPVACGNVRERSFGEIWRDSPILGALRDEDRLKGKCGACEFKRICLGCRARAYSDSGDYLAEEPYCTHTPVRASRCDHPWG